MADFTAGSVLTAAQLDTAFNTFTERAVVTTTATLGAADAGELLSVNNNSGGTVTIPLNSTWGAETGTHVTILNAGTAGTWTIGTAVGVTLEGSTTTLAPGAAATVIKRATNTWRCLPFSAGDAPTVSGTTGSPSTSTVTVGSRTGTLYDFGSNGSITFSTAGKALVCAIGGANADNGSYYGNAGTVFYGWIDLTAATHTIVVGAAASGANEGGHTYIGSLVSAPGAFKPLSATESRGAGRGFSGAALYAGYPVDITGSSVTYGSSQPTDNTATEYGSSYPGHVRAGRVFIFIPN